MKCEVNSLLNMTEYRLWVTSPRTFWGSQREHLVSWELAYSRRKTTTNKNNNHNDKIQANKERNCKQKNKLPSTENKTSKAKQQQQRPQQRNKQQISSTLHGANSVLMLSIFFCSVSSQTAAVSNFRGYRK